MKIALDLAISPTDKADEIKNFIDNFAFWVAEQIEAKQYDLIAGILEEIQEVDRILKG